MKLRTLNQIAPWTEDFFFMPYGDRDELVICNPQDALCIAPVFLHSKKTLTEHIQLVNAHQIKKAMIVADDINFLRECPSLECLRIFPSFSATNFDFSPLYDMPNLRELICETVYGPDEDRVSDVDYAQLPSLEHLVVSGAKGHCNVHLAKGLTSLAFDNKQPPKNTLVNSFDGSKLENLSVSASLIKSLEGLENAEKLRHLELAHNRYLIDISELAKVKDTLTGLDIENCNKIDDFSVLFQMHSLERLRLVGSNVLPNLSFIRNMPFLRSFIFRMNVSDGDLSMCLSIPYVAIQNRRHYSHKDSDFQKNSV